MALESVPELIKGFFSSSTACNLSVIVPTYSGFWDGMNVDPLHITLVYNNIAIGDWTQFNQTRTKWKSFDFCLQLFFGTILFQDKWGTVICIAEH